MESARRCLEFGTAAVSYRFHGLNASITIIIVIIISF